jgi:hypothetical protein
MPIQNRGHSARRIAVLCQRILYTPILVLESLRVISTNLA